MIKRETLQTGFEKSVRSFVAREGRATVAHRLALEQLWPIFGLSLRAEPLDYQQVFGNSNPIILEIGFGTGTSLLQQAKANPQQNFIGVEVYRTGIAKLLYGIQESKLTNIRVFCADATEVLRYCVADNALTGLQLFFPDPWPKLRHHKRRIVQPEFVALVQQKLICGGFFHLATDWEQYSQHMLSIMQQSAGWEPQAPAVFIAKPATRSTTKFEVRGKQLGHGTWDLIFYRAQTTN